MQSCLEKAITLASQSGANLVTTEVLFRAAQLENHVKNYQQAKLHIKEDIKYAEKSNNTPLYIIMCISRLGLIKRDTG